MSEASLRDRVAALSPDQRRALARSLVTSGNGPGQAELVAHIAVTGTPPSPEELTTFLRDRLPPHMVPTRYLALDRLPRTAAGKLDRHAVAALGARELTKASGGIVAPRTPVEETLAEIWTDVLAIDEVSVHDDFFEIGGDSLLSIRVISRAGKAGVGVRAEDFFENPTIAAMAARVAKPSIPADTPEDAEQGIVTDRAPLTPIQAWFFERITAHAEHWNQSFLLTPTRPIDAELLTTCVDTILSHHDGLRLRLVRDDDKWVHDFPEPGRADAVRVVDLVDCPVSEWPDRIEAEADREHGSFDLEAGSLFRVVLFDGGARGQRLLLVAHHLVVDAVSWGVLFEDLATLLTQAQTGTQLYLRPKTTSAAAWARALAAVAAELSMVEALSHWTDGAGVPAWTGSENAPPSGVNTVGDAETHTLSFDLGETESLRGVARTMGVSVEEILLGSLVTGLRSWTGRDRIQLDVEGHGRDAVKGLDASRTVGWFTAVFPLAVDLGRSGPNDAAHIVRDVLAALPSGRATHGLLRYLHPDRAVRERLAALDCSTVLFNYLGSIDDFLPDDAPFAWAPEPTGRARSAVAPRAYLIEVNAAIRSDGLALAFEYVPAVHGHSDIEALVRETDEVLRALLETERGGGRFSLAGLDAEGLSRVADLLAEADGE